MPRWWNGIHKGLKILWPDGHMGSTPIRGTTDKSVIVADIIDKTVTTAIVGTEKNPMNKEIMKHMKDYVEIISLILWINQ